MDNNFNFNTHSRSLLFKLEGLRYKIEEKYRSSVRFIKNAWKFRKALSQIYWWDYQGILVFMETFFRIMADNIEKHGNEENNSRMKKVYQMRRACYILKNHTEYKFLELAEKELGSCYESDIEFVPIDDKNEKFELVETNLTQEQKDHNAKVYYRSNEIEVEQWNEFCEILKGTEVSEQNNLSYESYIEKTDGRGLKTWWD